MLKVVYELGKICSKYFFLVKHSINYMGSLLAIFVCFFLSCHHQRNQNPDISVFPTLENEKKEKS